MIRPATPTDVPALLDLIRQLADFEREPDAVVNRPEWLHEVLFAPDASVFAHVAEAAGSLVGCAVWFVNYSTWTGRHGIYLEDLVVTAGARGTGVGRALLAELAAICVQRGYTRLDWSVLDWNEAAAGFYRSLGATEQTSWRPYRLEGAALHAVGASAAGRG